MRKLCFSNRILLQEFEEQLLSRVPGEASTSLLRYCICFLLISLGIFHVSAQDNVLSGSVLLSEKAFPKLGRLHSYNEMGPPRLSVEDIHVVLYPLTFESEVFPTQKAVITQKGERFIPQVLLVTPGTTVYFLNEDNQYHNVFSRSPGNSFNIGRRPPGHVYPKRIDRRGMVRIFCDIHEHMRAYVMSVDTPYFMRLNRQGRYYIEGLPDGTYRFEIFHPNLAPFSAEIELYGGGEQIRNWDLSRN